MLKLRNSPLKLRKLPFRPLLRFRSSNLPTSLLRRIRRLRHRLFLLAQRRS